MKWSATTLILCGLSALCACGRSPPSAPAGSPAPAAESGRVVNVYNWSDNIAPDTAANFEKQTGIKVNYDIFQSQEELEAKLLTGRSGYDVVDVTANVLERLIKAGVFQKLDNARLPNRRHLDPRLMALLASQDPGNQYAVGYMWGTTGIGYDGAKLRRLAPDAPTDSWSLLYDPRFASRLAPCGIFIEDAPSEAAATTLMYLGHDPNSTVPGELAGVERALMALRPHVRKIAGDGQIDDLANGEVCLMLTVTTNVFIARQRAQEAGGHPDFHYVIPREGTISWFDTLAIPADAPHPAEAHAFINFVMQPEVAASITNYVGNPSVNKDALPMIKDSIRNDPSIYPPPEVVARLKPLRARSQQQARIETRIWTRFKTGQ
jgi:putrescine transport system substrate-binding protein